VRLTITGVLLRPLSRTRSGLAAWLERGCPGTSPSLRHTPRAVLDVGYVASRYSRAALVRGRPCPVGDVANRATGTTAPAPRISWDYGVSGNDSARRTWKPPRGLSASSSLINMFVVGSGAPLIRCYRQQYSGATLNRTAGCISSTDLRPRACCLQRRRSCSAAVRVICSRFT
jgi:hypothetical protein